MINYLYFIILESKSSDKKMKKKTVLFSALFALFFLFTNAQSKLFGKVTDSKQEPVEGVLIYLDSINSGMKTNKRGYFEVMVPDGVKEINVYSNIYGLLSTPYNGESILNFMFLNPETPKVVEEESDSGYGKISNKDLGYSVGKVDVEAQPEEAIGYNTIYDFIRARVAGVRVTDTNRIIIRGRNSVNSSSDPLFVVDGTIVVDISFINPMDVKEITVLKDAAAAIYGSRGANGVIKITLKK